MQVSRLWRVQRCMRIEGYPGAARSALDEYGLLDVRSEGISAEVRCGALFRNGGHGSRICDYNVVQVSTRRMSMSYPAAVDALVADQIVAEGATTVRARWFGLVARPAVR
jgi:hypothetical protein